MARIYRDRLGVPHVRGASVADLAHGQGQVTARDRTWQLEWQRRRATGTTAEVCGPGGLAWDDLSRRTRIAAGARAAFGRLDEETRGFLGAYVDGVNEALGGVRRGDIPELGALGIDPGRWEPWTPVAVFAAQHLLFASLQAKLWRQRARDVLGDDAHLFDVEGVSTSGSNAWAVGGARTASGLPLVAGDPHRTIESPGVYQQVRLACEDPDDPFDVVGFTFPGVPGVQHFAHAGGVAWAITNAMADYQDVYVEQLRRREDGRVQALGPDGWRGVQQAEETVAVAGAAPVVVEVLVTERGPVFQGSAEEGAGLSLRAASDVGGRSGLEALLPLLRVRVVADVDRALDAWVQPVNNVVAADTTGRVLYRVAGAVPVRDQANRAGTVPAADPTYDWRGWVGDLPRHEVAPDGQVVTANERRGPESGPIGDHFAAPHRARRITALLTGRTGLTVADMAAVHGDVLLPTLDLVRTIVTAAAPQDRGADVRRAILAWDGQMDARSAGAAAYAAWRSELTHLVAASDPLAPLVGPAGHGPVLDPSLDLTTHVGLAFETLVRAGTPFGLDLVDLAGTALDRAAGHPAVWGDTHVLHPTHGLALVGRGEEAPVVPGLPVSGENDTVRCTGWLPGVLDAAYRGSVARYVWDLADRTRSGWVVPMGASGDPASPHHLDQSAPWAAAELVPVVTDWEQLTEEG